MAKKYYNSETIEFQNGDSVEAKQLTIKRLRGLNEVFKEHEKLVRSQQKRVADMVEAKRKEKDFDEDKAIEEVQQEIEDEDGPTYLDTLLAGAYIAMDSWGVKDKVGKRVEIDQEYIEENLDYPTIVRINEIAGSMELGDASDAEKK